MDSVGAIYNEICGPNRSYLRAIIYNKLSLIIMNQWIIMNIEGALRGSCRIFESDYERGCDFIISEVYDKSD